MKELLDLKIESRDHGDDLTIRGYFELLLLELWKEGESFSGKRPFGNSGWEYDLYKPLIKANVIKGKLDSDGYIESVDEKKAHKKVIELINLCFK